MDQRAFDIRIKVVQVREDALQAGFAGGGGFGSLAHG